MYDEQNGDSDLRAKQLGIVLNNILYYSTTNSGFMKLNYDCLPLNLNSIPYIIFRIIYMYFVVE